MQKPETALKSALERRSKQGVTAVEGALAKKRGMRLTSLAVLMPLAISGRSTLSSMFDSGDGSAHAVSTQSFATTPDTNKDLRLARAARSAGDYVSAINLYRTVIATRPQDEALVVELGDTMLDLGAVDDAIGVYGKVSLKSPARAGAEVGLGRAQLSMHQAEAALAHFDAAHMLAPNDAKALLGRGIALDILNRHQEAQESYRTVMTTDPRNVAARNDLALSLALTGDYAQAASILQPIAMSPTATERIRQNMALIYGLQGNTQQAARISRVDLSEADTEANLRFYQAVRGHADRRAQERTIGHGAVVL